MTPNILSGNWELQETLLLLGALLLVLVAAVGLLFYCRHRRAHKPVAREDPDLLARSVGVDTQAAASMELSPLSASSHDHLSPPEPGKASLPSELLTFGPSPKHRPVVCSVPPRLPPAAPPSCCDEPPAMKRTWSGEELG